MYLLDTNVVSEFRKKAKTNKGVKAFLKSAEENNSNLYLSVITLGELRRGVEAYSYRFNIIYIMRN